MKPLLIVSGWLGIATYCILATIAGHSGLIATRSAYASAGRMGRNIAELQSINTAYTLEWEAMSALPESSALEARSLGYLAVDEVAIRLSVPSSEPSPASPGDRLVHEPVTVLDEASIRKIAAGLALLVLVSGMVLKLRKPGPRVCRTLDREV